MGAREDLRSHWPIACLSSSFPNLQANGVRRDRPLTGPDKSRGMGEREREGKGRNVPAGTRTAMSRVE